jgi:hypothetical protein
MKQRRRLGNPVVRFDRAKRSLAEPKTPRKVGMAMEQDENDRRSDRRSLEK